AFICFFFQGRRRHTRGRDGSGGLGDVKKRRVHSKRPDGSVPPIGATVFGHDGRSNGVVGTDGEIFISGVADGDRLLVKWGSGAGDACSLVLPGNPGNMAQPTQGYDTVSLICNTVPEAPLP
ncbi:hypothetical protein GIW54_30810, partial [Pseudomonas proteolytica]|nr:hypothetical protein [Pseudomonas proteolytica]